MNEPFKWDDFSDQPEIIKDKSYKKTMRRRELKSLLKTFATSLVMLPISLVAIPFVKRKEVKSKDFFSLVVDFERESEESLKLIEELGVERVLLRFKLWEMQKLDKLKDFIDKLEGKKIILKVMQDRENIEDLELFRKNLKTIFETLDDKVGIYEIGSTINRAKWGFFSVDEYSRFYKTAYELKKSEFKHLKLMGSSVIDFEFHYTAHTLFNFFDYRFDAISSLLYVDRRGAPENTQLGFALSDKIALLASMVSLSPKTKHQLHITETNWPISGTAPYAPTSEYECVDEKSYGEFMLRYYLLALASQQVDSVSWHQLLARGYGLVDNVEGMRKREAFYIYKYMVQTLRDAEFLRLDIKRDYYILQFMVNEQLLQIHWSLKPTTLKNEDFFIPYNLVGKKLKGSELEIGSSPVYLFITKEAPQKINSIG